MASNYFCQSEKRIIGPVAFRSLVKLVREGKLGADDLVKADWEPEWHPAASVVGLFHMAGRDDVLAIWEAEQREKERLRLTETDQREELGTDELAEMMNAAELMTEGQQNWQERLLEAEAVRQAEARERYDQLRADREFEKSRQRIAETISAAAAAADAKEQPQNPGTIRGFFSNLFSHDALHFLFRWGLTLVVANWTAVSILNWSEAELLRYPDKNTLTSGMKIFPFWGACSPSEYFFLLFDVMIAVGIVGYGGARLLESMAED